MEGKRVDCAWWTPDRRPGDYWREDHGWGAVAPNGMLCNLAGHRVTEHDDGSITVSPSILVSNGVSEPWHGYLERGVWRAV